MGEIIDSDGGDTLNRGVMWMGSVGAGEPWTDLPDEDEDGEPVEWTNVGYLTSDGLTDRAFDQAVGDGSIETLGQFTASEVTRRWLHIIDRLADTDPEAARLANEGFQRWREAARTNWPGEHTVRVESEPLIVRGSRSQGCRKDGLSAADRAEHRAMTSPPYVLLGEVLAQQDAEEEDRIRRWRFFGGGD